MKQIDMTTLLLTLRDSGLGLREAIALNVRVGCEGCGNQPGSGIQGGRRERVVGLFLPVNIRKGDKG